MKNHYDILGIAEDANLDEIKKAYRKLSMKFHPDKNENDAYFSDLFKRITEAYETLADVHRRARYNAMLKSHSNDEVLENDYSNKDEDAPESTPKHKDASHFYDEQKRTAQAYEDIVVNNENKRKSEKRIVRRVIILVVLGLSAFYFKDEIGDAITEVKLRYFNQATLRGTVVAPDGLNMRANPNDRAKVIFTLPTESSVLIIDETGPTQTINGITANWFKVLYNDKEGWVWSGYILRD